MHLRKLAVLGALCLAALSVSAAPRYELETFDKLPGATLEGIGAFNDQGQFAATWRLPRRQGLTLTLYTPGIGYESLMPSGLPVQSGGDFGAKDMNERGEVAALVNGNAYVLRAGGPATVVPGTGGRYSGAMAIDDAGRVVGFREDPGAYRAYAWSTATGFETLPFRNSLAEDLNDNGQVLVHDGGSGRTRYWRHDLNTGGSTEIGIGMDVRPDARINDQGDVVFTTGPGHASRIHLWHDGVVSPIAGPAGSIRDEVLDFNNHGLVLGQSILRDGATAILDSFLHQVGGPTFSLQSLIDPADLVGWEGIAVSRINDRGDIVGWGVRENEFDWTPLLLRSVAIAGPVPEPATWGMGLLGAMGVVATLRRRRTG